MENNNSRRDFIKKTASIVIGSVAATALTDKLNAATLVIDKTFSEASKFTLPELPYAYDALEPHIDRLTMEIHHSKHHKAYVDNLNKALEGINAYELPTNTLKEILNAISKFPVAVRNNAGGHYNHSLFWKLMSPNGGGLPKGTLLLAINNTFGSFDNFKKQFTQSALSHFGSGWVWLTALNGELKIGSTPNQDNPLMDINTFEIKGNPVLALDIWEHAYYLKNQNRRSEYVNSWWEVVNWDAAENLYSGK
jgi:superoxide dismutase, Fe-Mn family